MNKLARSAQGAGPVHDLHREVDQFFEGLLPGWRSRFTDDPESSVWMPRTDVLETEDSFEIVMDLPGLRKEEVQLNFQDNVLSVSGERRNEQWQQDGSGAKRSYYRIERRHGRFHRSFTLPKAIDAEKIRATYDNGVLSISVPKAEALKPRRIDVL